MPHRPMIPHITRLLVVSSLAPLLLAMPATAQGEVQIPTDAQLDRMERGDIATPPLSVGAAGVNASEQSEDRSLDQQDRAIDRKVMRGICTGC